MAQIITSPDEPPCTDNWGNIHIFLAGGISNCDDWQRYVAERLRFELPNHVLVFNPRREGEMDPTHEPSAREQITWEFRSLNSADVVLFWFPAGGPNPIALFELGKELMRFKTKGAGDGNALYVGADKDNARFLDIDIQTQLMFPNFGIFTDLPEMIDDLVYQFKRG